MMLQLLSQRAQLELGASLLARDAGAAYERRQQRQSPRARMTRVPPLRLKALKLIALKTLNRLDRFVREHYSIA